MSVLLRVAWPLQPVAVLGVLATHVKVDQHLGVEWVFSSKNVPELQVSVTLLSFLPKSSVW